MHLRPTQQPSILIRGATSLHFLAAVVAILVGTIIYVVYGSDTFVINKVLRGIHLGGLIDTLRAYAPANLAPLRNQVPDGLWVYAGTTLMINVWSAKSTGVQLWIFCPLMFGLAGELGQYVNVVPGTFDLLDIFSMLTGCILSYVFTKKRFVP